MRTYKKKGQSMGAISNIIALIIGVGIAVLVLIFVGVFGGSVYNQIEPDILEIGNTSASETFTPLNGTAVSLGHEYIHSGSLVIYNSTATQGLGNYTIDYTAGTALLKTNLANGTAHTANFTYGHVEIQANVKNSILSGFEALEQTGNYTPLIVLAVVISLILALVLGFTAFGGSGSSGTAL